VALAGPVRAAVPSRSSDERRVHRPFDPGDLDLDLADLLHRRGALLAQERRGIAAATGLAMQDEEGHPGIRERMSLVGLVDGSHGRVVSAGGMVTFDVESVTLPLSDREDRTNFGAQTGLG